MLQDRLVPKLAFDLLNNKCEAPPGETKSNIPNAVLIELHSYFGNVLTTATELLEKCKIFRYQTPDKSRSFYKIGAKLEWYTIYEDVNYCNCDQFRTRVLENGDLLTCKHVLAIKLNKIVGTCKVRQEEISCIQLEGYLNQQLVDEDIDSNKSIETIY